MKPEWRPISFTRPTPPGAERASMCAARIDSVARENAVRKPKLWSMNGMSLSIVFGTPTIAIRSLRARRSRRRCRCAPRSEPSPPITNRMLMPSCSRQSTISSGSCCPREVPRIVPPSSLMLLHDVRVEVHHRVAVAGDEPLVAVAEADDPAARRSARVSSITSPRMTLLSPGQRPPQVTIPTRVLDGSKKILRRGPPASKPGSSATSHAARGDHRRRVVEQHAVAGVDPVMRAAPDIEQVGERRVSATRSSFLTVRS